MSNVATFVVFRMKLAGQNVKAWAELNGYKPDTVYKTIRGVRGGVRKEGESVRIIDHLKRDGFWPSEDELQAVSNG